MRWLAAFVPVLVIVACGGSSNPGATPTPSAAPVSPTPSPDVSRCDSALPEGEVAFQGHVRLVHDAGPRPRTVEVILDRIAAEPGAAIYGVEEYVPDSILAVTLLEDELPTPQVGDCVIGTGRVQRYACGAACDAAGFVAEVFVVADGTIDITPSPAQVTEPAPRPNLWFAGRVDLVRDTTESGGTKATTVRVADVGVLGDMSPSTRNVADVFFVEVILFGPPWPEVAVGDFVEVAGAMGAYPPSPSSDAYGFLATYLKVLG